MASISTRVYIRWLPDEASEPTSTLVLTSRQKRFVDIRILNPAQGNATIAPPSERLEWAFAGTSTSSSIADQSDGKHRSHNKWHHWIDSRHERAEDVTDEGDMEDQADGSTLEKGRMVNPATGRMTDYEECWQDVKVKATDDTGKSKCIVMRMEDKDKHGRDVRGMVIRVGQYVQGIARIAKHLALEQWEWEEGQGWRSLYQMGNFWLPCGLATDGSDGRLQLGGKVRHGDYVWEVIESEDL